MCTVAATISRLAGTSARRTDRCGFDAPGAPPQGGAFLWSNIPDAGTFARDRDDLQRNASRNCEWHPCGAVHSGHPHPYALSDGIRRGRTTDATPRAFRASIPGWPLRRGLKPCLSARIRFTCQYLCHMIAPANRGMLRPRTPARSVRKLYRSCPERIGASGAAHSPAQLRQWMAPNLHAEPA